MLACDKPRMLSGYSSKLLRVLEHLGTRGVGAPCFKCLFKCSNFSLQSSLEIIIIRRFIKRRSSAEAEGKGAVHVFKVLAAIIRMFKKMCFEPRFKCLQGCRILHIIWEYVPRSGSCDREGTKKQCLRPGTLGDSRPQAHMFWSPIACVGPI